MKNTWNTFPTFTFHIYFSTFTFPSNLKSYKIQQNSIDHRIWHKTRHKWKYNLFLLFIISFILFCSIKNVVMTKSCSNFKKIKKYFLFLLSPWSLFITISNFCSPILCTLLSPFLLLLFSSFCFFFPQFFYFFFPFSSNSSSWNSLHAPSSWMYF